MEDIFSIGQNVELTSAMFYAIGQIFKNNSHLVTLLPMSDLSSRLGDFPSRAKSPKKLESPNTVSLLPRTRAMCFSTVTFLVDFTSHFLPSTTMTISNCNPITCQLYNWLNDNLNQIWPLKTFT